MCVFELTKAAQNLLPGDSTEGSPQDRAPRRSLNETADCCAERLRQKKELDLVLGERDILGTQLIRRNDELALLYEKGKIQQSTLSRGQIQYRDRCAGDLCGSKDMRSTGCCA